ncbi:MAG: hypothetical protein KDC33_08150 [Thermoleophilia bacterium]|nr:hypothetical protein [Thermoleophilia bacterium]
MPEPISWDAASTPVGAHAVAEALLAASAYAHTRGVAQQAARIARARGLSRDDRAALLCAAWLHAALGARRVGRRACARQLRAAGHERLARIVAHHRFGAMEAALCGDPPVEDEFPIPDGTDEMLLMMLDAAVFTTDAAGAPASPAAALRDMVEDRGAGDAEVRAAVALLDRLGDDPAGRAMVEAVARVTSGGSR